MIKKTKMTKDKVPDDFTLSLAVVDALPVLFFGGSMILIAVLFKSAMFFAGALLCFLSGAGKVLWKIIVVTKKRNVWWLFMQMRIVMPAGFLMMLLAVIINLNTINASNLWEAAVSFPSVIFFAVGTAGMILMGVFGAVLESSDARSNWIEQLTNTIAQAAIFAGILLLM